MRTSRSEDADLVEAVPERRSRSWARRVSATRSDAGVSLPELLIGSILMAVVGSICVAVVVNVTGGLGKTDNDLRGLQEMRTLQERLSRDLLQARGVTSTSNASQVTVWIDDNGDYMQTPAELYRWLVGSAGTGSVRQVQRVNVGTGATEVIARTVVSSTAFTYTPTAPSTATVVGVDLQYNAGVGALNRPRRLYFSTRMRNHL
jgi:Tfp pilus assembly protein FimT